MTIISQTKSPARRGNTGRGFRALNSRKSATASSGLFVQVLCGLVYHLNDAAAARLDQHGRAINHGVAEWRAAETLRHIVVSHAGFGQHGADHDAVWNGES